MQTAENKTLNEALGHVKRGWVPIPLRGKRPIVKGWPKLGVPDESTVRDWWRTYPAANLGVVCGKTSGFFVLDADVKNGGIENLDLLESEYGPLPDTLVAQTGGGGRHYFFKFPSGGLGNATGQLPRGLDIRGEGGQVAVHPSVHESGRTYEWQDAAPDEIEIASAPAWLLGLIKEKVSSNGNGARKRLDLQDFSEIPEGERNTTLFRLGCSLRAKGSSEEEITNVLHLHNDQRCNPQLNPEDIQTIIGSVLKYAPGSSNGQGYADVLRVGCYEMTDDGIFFYKSKGDEESRIRLTNFPAHIAFETREDDGVEVNTKFEISAKLRGRNYKFSVPSSEYCSLGWVVREIGAGAIITPGSSYKDNARAAVQYLSGDIDSRTVYAHTGWRKIGKDWVFLTASGPIGPEGPLAGVDISLGEGKLKDYSLPAPPQGDRLIEVINASLDLLELAPPEITYPLLSAIYRAPLGECLFSDFSLFIAGPSGCQKSELTGIAQSHFGKGFHGKNLPGNWASTSNALEKESFTIKDCIFVVDDYCPKGSSSDIARLGREADRLFRGQANRSGRGRMWANGELRPERYARGLIISSGEDLPPGSSLRARLWITEVAPGDVDLEKLTDVQLKSGEGVYSETMAAYVQWLAPRIDELKKTLPEEKIKLRAMARHKKFNHDRTPDMLASLLPGLQYFLKFAVDSGAIDQDRAEELEYAGWRHMGEAADRQGAHQQAEDPARRFMDLVSGALASGTAHVVDADLGDQPLNSPESWGWRPFLSEDSNMHYQPKGQKIGWVDTKDNLYLEPNTTFALVQRIGNDQGAPISVSQQTLWKRLSEKGWILKENQKGHHTIRRKIEGHRRRVVQLIFKLPPVSEAVQAVPDGPQENNANENNEVGTASVDRFSENGQKGGPQNGPQPQQNQQPGPDGPDGPPVEQGVQENFNEGEL